LIHTHFQDHGSLLNRWQSITRTATTDVIAAIFKPSPAPNSGEWMEESERLYRNLQTEWRASRGNVVTVAASTSAQKRRDKSLAMEKTGVAGELAVIQ